MKLEETKSHAELSKFIESYWHFDGGLERSLMLFPDGTFNVIIAMTDFSVGSKQYARGTYLIPINTKPIQIHCSGTIFGIRFKAFSMINIAGKNVSHLNSINLLESCLEKPVTLVRSLAKLNCQQDLLEVRSYLENLAFDLLNHRYFLNENMREQVNYILDRKGVVRITDFCNDFGISRQAMHKSFKGALGIGPKELATTWRLNYYFTLMSSGNSLTETALDAGFYDQAHSINAFKLQWSLSPTNMQKMNPVVFQFAQQNMNKRFSNYYDPEV